MLVHQRVNHVNIDKIGPRRCWADLFFNRFYVFWIFLYMCFAFYMTTTDGDSNLEESQSGLEDDESLGWQVPEWVPLYNGFLTITYYYHTCFFPKKRGFHMIHMISWDLTTINGDRPKKETGIQAWSRSTDSVTAGIDLQYLQAMVLWKIWKVRESDGDWRSFYGIFLVFMNFPTWAASEALYQSTEGWRWSTFSQGVQADQAARCVAKGPMDLL